MGGGKRGEERGEKRGEQRRWRQEGDLKRQHRIGLGKPVD